MAARATAAEIKKLFLGVWPLPATDTNVADILSGIDYMLDGYVKRYYNVTLSATDTDVVHIANMMGKQVVLDAVWSVAGGTASTSTGPRPEVFTQEIKDLIEAVVVSQTYDGSSTLETISED